MLETKRQVIGQMIVCRGCCCGATEKGRPGVPVEWLKGEWRKRGLLKRFQLTISGCIGPCDIPNIVEVTSESGSFDLAWKHHGVQPIPVFGGLGVPIRGSRKSARPSGGIQRPSAASLALSQRRFVTVGRKSLEDNRSCGFLACPTSRAGNS
jgi:hypothetical protein